MSHFFRKTVLPILVIYLLACGGLYLFQRSFLYFPNAFTMSPDTVPTTKLFKTLNVRTSDGLDIKGWYVSSVEKQFTIVFFHGNGDNLYSAAHTGDPFTGVGYGFLLAEYRGYSSLSGKPSEKGLYADARAFIKELIDSGVEESNIILMGHSLGTGVAMQMATEFRVGGLVLLAPYTSMVDLAQARFLIFPARLLTLDRFENAEKIERLHTPLLIINGDLDMIVPPSQGQQLFEMANKPKQFHALLDRGHNDLFDKATPLILDWLERQENWNVER